MIQTPDPAVEAVVDILRSKDPEGAFLEAIEDGTISDEVCLDLAEYLGEAIKVSNLDNTLGIVEALWAMTISAQTRLILSEAVILMAEEDEEEIPSTTVDAVLQESSASASKLAPTDLIRSAVELQQQYRISVPAAMLADIRARAVPTTDEHTAVRHVLGSVILAEAELVPSERRVDVAATLQIVEILLGRQQAELTAAVFAVYETLFKEGFRLRDRDTAGRPFMTVTSLSFLRNRFRIWLDSHEPTLDAKELATYESTVARLESFLKFAGHESVKMAINRDLTVRGRERNISSGIRVKDAIAEEVVAALPHTKEAILRQAQGCLTDWLGQLCQRLRLVGGVPLAEVEREVQEILYLASSCAATRRELSELASLDYNPALERPKMSRDEQRVLFFEAERKDLDSIRLQLEEQVAKAKGKAKLKLAELLVTTIAKLAGLDDLIVQASPKPAIVPVGGIPAIPLPPPISMILAKEASHG